MKFLFPTIILVLTSNLFAQSASFSRINLSLPKATQPIAVGDLNNDNKPDLIIGRSPDNVQKSGNISVLYGNTNGSFQSERTFSVGSATGSGGVAPNVEKVAAADFNGDNNLDIVVLHNESTVSSFSSNYLTFLFNDGNGVFRTVSFGLSFPQIPEVSYGYARGLTIADLNNDNKKDIFIGGIDSRGSGFLTGIKNNGNNNFEQSFYSETFPIIDLSFGKFNQDNNLDLVLSGENGNGVIFGNGNFSFSGTLERDARRPESCIAVGDFNSDGLDDYAVADVERKEIRVFINTANGIPNLPRIYKFKSALNTYSFRSLVTSDFNGDGKLDLAVPFYNESKVRILYGLGGGGFARGDIFQVGKNSFGLAAADFNNDGKIDLAVTNNQATPNEQLNILINNTNNN